MISALKQSEDGQGIVLRVWNTSSETLDAMIRTMLPVTKAAKLRLDETKQEISGTGWDYPDDNRAA